VDVTFHVCGIGTALPDHRIGRDDAAELHATFCGFGRDNARTLRALYRRSAVDTRHSVLLETSQGELDARQSFYPPASSEDDRGPTTVCRMAMYEEHAPPLATTAATRAMEDGGVEPDEVTHLITVSCTGFVAPGVDTAIVENLGLSRETRRTHVGFMGCHGGLIGLRTADALTGADPDAVPLVCSVELCTLHFSYEWEPELLVANALFSDGAAAVVGRAASSRGAAPRRPGPRHRGGNAATPEGHGWCVTGTGTFLSSGAEDAMTWRIGDHGFRMTLSPRVPELIEDGLRPWIVRWLADSGLGLADVGSWAIHPGGPRILSSARKALDLPREATEVSSEVLSECGNMSSATILFVLERMRERDAPRPCVALAFGPGLAVEATLLL
jgi:predicted naringenin-chalcone synthase